MKFSAICRSIGVNTAVPWDYLELARRLRLAGVLADPAEAHGMAYGLTTVARAASLDRWQTEVCADCHAGDERLLECQQMLVPLYQDAQRQQTTGNIPTFCMPPDNQDIRIRAVGLRDWCRGFLYGLGLTGCIEPASLSPEAQEALVDISELTRLEVPQHHAGEQEEVALADLLDYLEVAVSIVCEDVRMGLTA